MRVAAAGVEVAGVAGVGDGTVGGGNAVAVAGDGLNAAAAADGLDTAAEGDKTAGTLAVGAGAAAGVGDWLVPLHAAISAGTASTRSTTIRGISDVNRSVRTGSLATTTTRAFASPGRG